MFTIIILPLEDCFIYPLIVFPMTPQQTTKFATFQPISQQKNKSVASNRPHISLYFSNIQFCYKCCACCVPKCVSCAIFIFFFFTWL